ncbi:MAG: hypothetical protein JXQ96_15940 [Cyclobacteriaceae bacterium]
MEPVIVFVVLFATIFGICYVFFTTRNSERLALIEKGMDASLLSQKKKPFSIAKFILNIALLFIGIGMGIFFGDLLSRSLQMDEEVTIPSMLFIFGGIGLITGFFITKNLENKDS